MKLITLTAVDNAEGLDPTTIDINVEHIVQMDTNERGTRLWVTGAFSNLLAKETRDEIKALIAGPKMPDRYSMLLNLLRELEQSLDGYGNDVVASTSGYIRMERINSIVKRYKEKAT